MKADVPIHLVAGSDWTFSMPAASAPYRDGASVHFSLKLEAGGHPEVVEAAWTGQGWVAMIPGAETATKHPGRWICHAIAINGLGSRQVGEPKVVEVAPDPMTFTGDSRSQAARILEAIEVTIEGRATSDHDSYTIEGRQLSRTPIGDLLRLRNVYRAQVAAERGDRPFGIRRVTH